MLENQTKCAITGVHCVISVFEKVKKEEIVKVYEQDYCDQQLTGAGANATLQNY